MKKIIPFNNILEFNTDVKEITAISLEHEINKSPDTINGVFYISGEYKITEGILDKEKFDFELPFDIALSDNYLIDTLIVDIDDFRYNLISDKNLKVNIDLYIDGEIEPPSQIIPTEETIEFLNREDIKNAEEPEITLETEEEYEKEKNEDIEDNLEKDKEEIIESERIDLLTEMLNQKKENNMPENININNNNENEIENKNNFLEPETEEKYVTYRVYTLKENDTIDTVLTKYNIKKELLADYNNIENITTGDKLIIPTNDK